MRRTPAIGSFAIAIAALLGPLASNRAEALVWPDVPDRIERGLASPDPASRRVAARELSTLGVARATPLVLKALGDQDLEVRLGAAQSAVRLRVPQATDVVMQWLGERESRVRIAACDVAQALPNPRAVQPLARSLGDTDPQVRASCADALGAQGSAEAVAPLSGKLDDPTPNVRVQVARALSKLGDPRAVVPLVGKVQDSVPDVRQAVVRALGDLGDPRASQALLLALRDNVQEVKVEALGALGRLKAPDAVDAIAPLALDRNPGTRQAALVALGRIGTPSAVNALIRALGAQEDATGTLERTPTRDALVAAGATAVTELTALLERPVSPAAATGAAWVLGELRATKSAPAIVSALRKGTLPPAAALRALTGAGTAAEVPVVLEFVADPSPVVREEALRAATALLDPSRPDGRAVEPLAATLKSSRLSPQERAAIATLLGRTGAPRAANELAPLVAAKDPALRLAAVDALGALGGGARGSEAVIDDALVPLLNDESPVLRLHAAVALGASGGPKAKAALASKLGGGDETDRFALLTAIGGILGRTADDAIAARVLEELAVAAGPERDAVIEAAGRNRSANTVRALSGIAKSSDADDRRAVAAVLGAHQGSAEAIAIARALTTDADKAVRAQAAWTLGTLGDASTVATLLPLVKSPDSDVATNAAGAIARLSITKRAPAVAATICPLLADPRSGVRANALVALAGSSLRCSDGRAERRLLADDPNDLVRAAAARLLLVAPTPDDKTALERCATSDRSTDVARACKPRTASTTTSGTTTTTTRAVTMFIVGESGTTARPHAAFLLEHEGGILRAGVADRRGATFEPAAPAGDVLLRRPLGR